MSLPRPAVLRARPGPLRDRARPPVDRASVDRARRWRRLGLVGSLLLAVSATAVGDLPTSGALGTWPRLIGAAAHPSSAAHPWPAVLAAYLGLTLVAGAWWQLGRATRDLPDRLSFLLVTGVLWALPLLLAPPLYSRDVYSYLAQGSLYAHGLDPYRVGPAALGGPLAADVSAIWQNTPAPYGPVFLGVAAAVTSLAGGHIVLAVILMRLVMVASLALTAACLIPLARRFGVDPAHAVWLGVLNPLCLANVVSGAHNDALMVALMVAGVLLAVRRRPVIGAVVIGLAVLVKLPAAAALVVIVPAMARELRGRWRPFRAGLIISGAAAATMLAVTVAMGTWYGWVSALSDTARVRNGLSISTDLGIVVNGLAGLLGMGFGSNAVSGSGSGSVDAVTVLRDLGVILAAVLIVVILLRARGKPLFALALVMLSIVLLGPVVHPWYLLWGIVPIAASARDRRLVTLVAGTTIGLALYPMPWGEGFSSVAAWGVLGSAVALLILWLASRRAPARPAVALPVADPDPDPDLSADADADGPADTIDAAEPAAVHVRAR